LAFITVISLVNNATYIVKNINWNLFS